MKIKKVIVLAGALLSGISLYAQRNSATISGYITDGTSGETLIGAGVLVDSGAKTPVGAVTNVYGYYTLTIPRGNTKLQFSYLGYESITMDIRLQRDTTINIVMDPSATLEASKVVAQRDAGIQSTFLGALDVPVVHIKNAPVLFGEADVLKAIQMMPGVQGGNEGFTGLYVRGGGPDENLVLLDGNPIYNVDHMLGILSVFQTEAVKKVTLYKGSFPARYGGRVSSIVDIRTNDGNMKETKGSFGVGVLTDKFHIEGPIIKDKLSYSFSARGLHTLMYDPVIRLFGYNLGNAISDPGTKTSTYGNYYFYDINGKISWRYSDRDRFYLGVYNGLDHLGVKFSQSETYAFQKTKMGIGWGNNVVSLRWNHIFSQRLFANTTVSYNSYRMLMNMGATMKEQYDFDDDMVIDEVYKYDFDFNYNSGIRDWSAKVDFDFVPSPRHLMKFGGGYTFHVFYPRTSTAIILEEEGDSSERQDFRIGPEKNYLGNEISMYVEDDFSVTDHFTVNPGMHFSWFITGGRHYVNAQPRLSAKFSFDMGLSFKAGYARMAQYVHLLSSTQISLPMDLWVPITKNIKPVTSDQVSAGVYYDAIPGWEFSVEGYYKWLNNILEYKDGASVLVSATGWEDKVEMGKGFARGLEFFIQKTSGDLTGWIAYTLAKSERLFPDGEINLGKRFPYKYDRRHNLNVNLNYAISKKWDLSASWSYMSGGMTTVPERTTVISEPSGNSYQTEFIRYRNNYRLPPSHHLNLGVNYHKMKTRGEAVWTLSVYNVYNRMNPNLAFVDYDYVYNPATGNYVKRLALQTVTILPIMPSLSYTYNF